MRLFIITAAVIIASGCTDRQMALIEGLVDKAVPGVVAPPVVAPTAVPQLTSQPSPPPAAVTEYAKVRIVVPVAKGGSGYKAIAMAVDVGTFFQSEAPLSVNEGVATLDVPTGRNISFRVEAPAGIMVESKTVFITGGTTIYLDRYAIQ